MVTDSKLFFFKIFACTESFNGPRFKATSMKDRGIRWGYVAETQADVNAKDGARK